MTKKQEVEARAYLQTHALKVTTGRVAVLQYMIRAHTPMVIEQIAKAVPDINVVTLYRMLKQFVDVGLVYQTDFRAGKAYFEFQAHHHHHITCTTCGVQESVDACLSDAYMKDVVADTKKFDTITNHALEFFGICTACKKHA